MKITRIDVERFGAWADQSVRELAPTLNVFFGANEAGKTTVLQFLRTVLYGLTADRKHRYVNGSHALASGGAIEVASPGGTFRIGRRIDSDLAAFGDGGGRLTVEASSGNVPPADVLRSLLGGLDEPTFNNVFAVGMRELQELSALSDTEAADLLYGLSVGTDRVSVMDVLGELQTARLQLLGADGQSGTIPQLLAQRRAMGNDLARGERLLRDYADLTRTRRRLDHDLTQCRDERGRWQKQVETIELASSLRPRWRLRQQLAEQMTTFEPLPELLDGAIEHIEGIETRLSELVERRKSLRAELAALRDEVDHLPLNPSLERLGPRIEALIDQRAWLAGMEEQVAQSEAKVAELTALIADGSTPGAKNDPASALPNRLRRSTYLRLRELAGNCRRTSAEQKRAQHHHERAVAAAGETARQLGDSLGKASGEGIPASLEQCGQLVAQLRRRTQIDQQLEQAKLQRNEIDEHLASLGEADLLPPWTLAGLGAIFALGVALILAGLLLPGSVVGHTGWALAAVGCLGTMAAGGAKLWLEQFHADQAQEAQGQRSALEQQMVKIAQERDELDAKLPRGGGPLLARLADAEKMLATLEQQLPAQQRHRTAAAELEALQLAAQEALQASRGARRRWQDALADAGLPESVSPAGLRELARTTRLRSVWVRRRARLQSQQERLLQGLEGARSRVTRVLEEVGLQPVERLATHWLEQLQSALDEQATLVERRATIVRSGRTIRHAMAQVRQTHAKQTERRRHMLAEARAANLAELKQRATLLAVYEQLDQQHQAVDHELRTRLPDPERASAVAELLGQYDEPEMTRHWEHCSEHLHACDRRLAELHEERGGVAAHLAQLASDQSASEARLALGAVDQRLETAWQRWQALTVSHETLDWVRASYERDRQPQTLADASRFFERLTGGRYTRVWTAWGTRSLSVDRKEGNTLAVEVLSRGTREQLFLALRLALVQCYVRRGVSLPLVLDDLLVNFDAPRAKLAAELLKEFSQAGHQVFMFTCHEHLARMFHDLKVVVRTLPPSAEPLVFAEPVTIAAPALVPTLVPVSRPAALPRPVPRVPAAVRTAAPLPPIKPATDAVGFEDDRWFRMSGFLAFADWRFPTNYGLAAEQDFATAAQSTDGQPGPTRNEPPPSPPREPRRRRERTHRSTIGNGNGEEFAGEFNETVIRRVDALDAA